MEEHVALDSKKQKKFVKSLKGIKKLMKETGALPEKPQKEKKSVEGGKIKKKRHPRRGLVYLSHIPHGFYEHQMTEYFKQFGMVTNARVIRSKRTGRSKGHAFVEFKDISVAEVVAETMNNYLMGKRLIKAVFIPPKDQRVNAKRKPWNPQNNPGRTTKLNMKKAYNAKKSENEDMKIARKLFNNLTNTKNKLKELGVDYDFFTPVDVPEGLLDQIAVKTEQDKDKKDIDEKPNKKKKNKNKVTKDEATDEKANNIANTKQEKATKKEKKQNKSNKDVESSEKITEVEKKNKKQSNGTEKTKSAKNKKTKKENIENTVLESNKKQKLKEAGVKPLEDYISVVDDDDDSSYHFDSDEYDNELNEDSDASSDDEDNNEDDESDETDDKNQGSEDDDSDREEMQRNNKKIKRSVVPIEESKPKVKHVPFMELMKRKLTEKVSTPSKKPKFEKQSNKKLPSKQLKKKK